MRAFKKVVGSVVLLIVVAILIAALGNSGNSPKPDRTAYQEFFSALNMAYSHELSSLYKQYWDSRSQLTDAKIRMRGLEASGAVGPAYEHLMADVGNCRHDMECFAAAYNALNSGVHPAFPKSTDLPRRLG
jgi:hypothetical protein